MDAGAIAPASAPSPWGSLPTKNPGADTNAYPHAGPPSSPKPHPATPSDPKPEVEETTSEAAWGYRPDPAPASPGPLGRQCVYQPWLPARARCPGEPCQAMVMTATLPCSQPQPSHCALQGLSQGGTQAGGTQPERSQDQMGQERPGPQVGRMSPPQAPTWDPACSGPVLENPQGPFRNSSCPSLSGATFCPSQGQSGEG